jgi:protein tyrosine/serine phosphatase
VLAALRTVARAPGAALVHCAAGKDRTGTVVALALSVADADRQAIVDDYAASSERVEGVIGRLMASSTYAENLEGRPMSSHLSHPETMISFLRYIDNTFGSVLQMLIKMGWTDDDTDQLRAKLRS